MTRRQVPIRPELLMIGQNNVTSSPLGEGWQYWSRRLSDWTTTEVHVNHRLCKQVFLDA